MEQVIARARPRAARISCRRTRRRRLPQCIDSIVLSELAGRADRRAARRGHGRRPSAASCSARRRRAQSASISRATRCASRAPRCTAPAESLRAAARRHVRPAVHRAARSTPRPSDRVLARRERPVAALQRDRAHAQDRRARRPHRRFRCAGGSLGARIRSRRCADWFTSAGLECTRVHPVDTESGHLLVALARRALRSRSRREPRSHGSEAPHGEVMTVEQIKDRIGERQRAARPAAPCRSSSFRRRTSRWSRRCGSRSSASRRCSRGSCR